MSKLRALVLSSFASGFGICSIVFAIFTLLNEGSFANILRLIFTSLFFVVNLGFTINYYNQVGREINSIQRTVKGVKTIRNRA